MLLQQKFAESLIKELAGDKAVSALVGVFSKILANHLTLGENNEPVLASSFGSLAKIFSFIATPQADRVQGGLQVDNKKFDAAVKAAAEKNGLGLDTTPPEDTTLPEDTTPPVVSNPAPTGNGDMVSSYDLQQRFTSGYDSDYNYTNDKRIDALLAGTMWGKGTGQGVELTYSFPGSDGNSSLWQPNYGFGEPFNKFHSFNALQQEGTRAALNQWSEIANIHFTEVAETPDAVGDLRFAFSGEVTGNTSGWAHLPGLEYFYLGQTMTDYTVPEASGDVWLNPESYSDKDWLAGSYNYHTLGHEVGHALGLKHTFDTNGNGTVLNGNQDSFQYSIMSYTDHQNMGYQYTDSAWGSYSWSSLAPSSPMLYDVLAIQHLYGANFETRTGDDVYTFSSDAPFLYTIWDAGGTDSLDASNQSVGAKLNLNQGTHSSIGIKYDSYKTLVAAVDNLAIAFDVQIENAIGSAFDDIFIGNSLDNIFTGNGGSDKATGGGGTNTFIFDGDYADYTIKGSINNAVVTNDHDKIILNGIQNLQFDDYLHTLV